MLRTTLTRSNYISLITDFNDKTSSFNSPLISFFGHDCYSVTEALSFINDLESDELLPVSFVISAYADNDTTYDDEITSIYVFQDENSGHFILDADNMSGVPSRLVESIDDVFKESKEMIEELNQF